MVAVQGYPRSLIPVQIKNAYNIVERLLYRNLSSIFCFLKIRRWPKSQHRNFFESSF